MLASAAKDSTDQLLPISAWKARRALVDVHTARQELALPPKLTVGQIKGFTLYATRTILSGGGEELVELAKTNLRELATE